MIKQCPLKVHLHALGLSTVSGRLQQQMKLDMFKPGIIFIVLVLSTTFFRVKNDLFIATVQLVQSCCRSAENNVKSKIGHPVTGFSLNFTKYSLSSDQFKSFCMVSNVRGKHLIDLKLECLYDKLLNSEQECKSFF